MRFSRVCVSVCVCLILLFLVLVHILFPIILCAVVYFSVFLCKCRECVCVCPNDVTMQQAFIKHTTNLKEKKQKKTTRHCIWTVCVERILLCGASQSFVATQMLPLLTSVWHSTIRIATHLMRFLVHLFDDRLLFCFGFGKWKNYGVALCLLFGGGFDSYFSFSFHFFALLLFIIRIIITFVCLCVQSAL